LSLPLSSHILRRAVAAAASSSSSATSASTGSSECPENHRSMRVQVAQIPCLSDNYGFLLHDPVSGQTASIDTPDARALSNELRARGWTLTHIWNTHQYVKRMERRCLSFMFEACRLLTGPASVITSRPNRSPLVGSVTGITLEGTRS
jgi:hypothetical protein